MAAGAGHEINNPLAVISGQAQYLLGHAEEWFTEAGREKLAQARAAAARREAALEAGFTEEQRKIARAWLEGVTTACGS